MKRTTYLYLAIVSTMVLATGCSKEEIAKTDVEPQQAAGNIIVTGEIESAQGTKIYGVDNADDKKIQPKWEIGDEVVGYVNGTFATTARFTVRSVSENGVATFTVNAPAAISDGDRFNMFYVPGGVYDSKTGTFAVDWSEQDGTVGAAGGTGGVIRGKAYMRAAQATVTDGCLTMKFSNLMDVYKISGVLDKDGNALGQMPLTVTATDGVTSAGTIGAEGFTSKTAGLINVGYNGTDAYFVLPKEASVTTFRFGFGRCWWTSSSKEAKTYNGGSFIGKKLTEEELKPLDGLFSVSDTRQVKFAAGNLQYQASTNTWKFADHQWEALCEGGGNQTADADRSKQSKWIDLFGYGATGYKNEGASKPYSEYQPWATAYDQEKDYKYCQVDLSLADRTDWGYAVSGSTDSWYTLNQAEWEYFIDRKYWMKSNAPQWDFAYVVVNGVKGDMFFPDGWTTAQWPEDVPQPTEYNSCGKNTQTFGEYSIEQFQKIEAVAGVVFFPVTGHRVGTSVKMAYGEMTMGVYWTSTKGESSRAACTFASGDGRYCSTKPTGGASQTMVATTHQKLNMNPGYGHAVRLAIAAN